MAPMTPPPLPPTHRTVKLDKCPACDYSFRGLPGVGRCPECGFTYDEDTFILHGISRGMSTTSTGRKIGWIFIGLGAWLGPQALMMLAFDPGNEAALIMACFGIVWAGALVYLLITGKRERRGIEPFLFAAGGFGSCAGLNPNDDKVDLTRWEQIDDVQLRRIGPTWRRLRIGKVNRHGKLYDIALDAGVSCDEPGAAHVLKVLKKRIAVAHGLETQDDLLDDLPDATAMLDLSGGADQAGATRTGLY